MVNAVAHDALHVVGSSDASGDDVVAALIEAAGLYRVPVTIDRLRGQVRRLDERFRVVVVQPETVDLADVADVLLGAPDRAYRSPVVVVSTGAPSAPGLYSAPASGVEELAAVHVDASPAAAARLAAFVARSSDEWHMRLRSRLLAGAIEGYWEWDSDRDRVRWSDRTCEMLRVAPGTTPPRPDDLAQFIHPADWLTIRALVVGGKLVDRGADLSGHSVGTRLRIRGGDGVFREYLANAKTVPDDRTGRPRLVVGSLLDVSEQLRLGRELRASEARNSVLFHYMNDAAVIADSATGIVLDANEAAERLWGRSRAELVGSHQSGLHPDILDAQSRAAFRDHVERLGRDERSSTEMPIKRADGRTVITEISASLLEIGGRSAVLGMFRDVSERMRSDQLIRERESELQLTSRLAAMGGLAAGVGHELNNPLSYVIGNLSVIQDAVAASGDRDLIDAVHDAVQGATRMKEIVSDLAAITQADDSIAECDPCEVARISMRLAMRDLRHRADLVTELMATAPAAITSSRLSQVLLNLLSNAANSFLVADPHSNVIVLRIEQVDGVVRITVRDNGADRRPFSGSLSLPFGLAGDVRTRALELSICERLLAEVDGTLSVSRGAGGGSVATVEVPVAGVDPHEGLAPVRLICDARVLVLDDDELAGRVLKRMLGSTFHVTVRHDASTALEELLQNESFDVVICDLMMPRLTGEQLYWALAEERGDLADRMLFVTGGGVTPEASEFEAAMRRSGRVFLKPVDANELRAAVRRVLDA